MADGEAGLRIFNMSDPANPFEAGAVVTEGSFTRVTVEGNYAYTVAAQAGLRIIDVSNPASPTEVGFYANCCANSVVVNGNFVYIASIGAGLRIIDVKNPANPIEVGFGGTGSFEDVAVNGNYAYVADGPEGLRIIDVSDPTSPKEVGFFDTDGFAYRVAVSGNLAYVADQGTGLYIIRNDFVPTAVASPSGRTPERFHLSQSYPNPLRASLSNSGTTITFTLSKAAHVTLEVYNMLGEKVTTLVKGAKPAGEHVVNFNASSLLSGIYFYTLTAGDLKQTRKMVITR